MANAKHMQNYDYEEVPQFMDLTGSEMEIVNKIREQIMTAYGAEVTGDVVEIDEDSFVIIYTVNEKDQVVKFNRHTLKWEI